MVLPQFFLLSGSNELTLCRFILPDKATTVVTPTPGETIRWLVSRLLEKRGLRFDSFLSLLSVRGSANCTYGTVLKMIKRN